jgi:hypothetical protein
MLKIKSNEKTWSKLEYEWWESSQNINMNYTCPF